MPNLPDLIKQTTGSSTTDLMSQKAITEAIESGVGSGKENTANKDVSGGYVGLTLFKINLKNALGTIINFITSATTAARTWTFPDKDGTVAMTSDLPNVSNFITSPVYNSEIITAPTSGNLTLKNYTETYIGSLTSENVFTVVLPSPVTGKVNENILLFKIGASLPTITQPTGIQWRGGAPTLVINTSWTICYEQICTAIGVYEIWATAIKNS